MYRVLRVLRSAKFAVGRRAGCALLGVALLGFLGCRPRGTRQADSYPAVPAQVLRAPATVDVAPADLSSLPPAILGTSPLPLYDGDPRHPWNRLHQALYVHPGKVARASCRPIDPSDPSDPSRPLSRPSPVEGASTGCADRVVPLEPWPPLIEGPAGYGDESALLASSSVGHLAEPDRLARLLALIAASRVRAGDKAGQPWAALLFQSDLWERFDALDGAARGLLAGEQTVSPTGGTRDDARAARLLYLRDALGTLIRDVALPAARIAALPSNLPQLATAYPALLAGFPGPEWLEVITRSRDRPEPMPSPEKEYTRHAQVAGFRSVFRRYVSVPQTAGGGEWLRRTLAASPAAPTLPAGTRLAIVQIPLAISSEGELVPWTRTNLVELRTVLPPPEATSQAVPPTRLADLPLDVLEGRRAWLRLLDPPQAGLQRLAADAPFPLGGTCSPQPFSLNPMRAVCMMCHGRSGEILFGPMTHGPQWTRLLTALELPTTVVRDEKRQRPEWRALVTPP